MKCRGFTLLELVLATAIASFISVMLIAMWQQMGGIQRRVEWYADVYSRAAIMMNQFERDISGSFVPMTLHPSKQTKNGNDARIEKSDKKLFWGDHKLELLTCITNNPMRTYWSAKTGKPQQRIARIVYRLVPDKKHEGSFVLLRQESPELDVKQFTRSDSKIRAYQVIDGIKSIHVTYTALIKKDENKDTKTDSSGERVYVPKEVKVWQKNVLEDKRIPVIPQYITLKITLWGPHYDREYTFDCAIHISPRFEKTLPRTIKPKTEDKPVQNKENKKDNKNTKSKSEPQAKGALFMQGRMFGFGIKTSSKVVTS